MASTYRNLKSAWQCLPLSMRQKLRSIGWIGRLTQKVSDATIGGASHQEIYDQSYYQFVDETAAAAASVMSRSIIEQFKPRSLVDIGCGTGAFLAGVRELGVTVKGLEYSDAGLLKCQQRGLEVRKFDILQDTAPEWGSFDVVTSFEVAEHLPAQAADRYVDLLCRFAKTVVMTAATPGQGGADHVNEQPHQYWIDRFESRSYRFSSQLALDWRQQWKNAGVPFWYHQNVMIFQNAHPA